MLEQIGRLRSVGYAVFILAHTKNKDKTDVVTGEQYEQVTNNLISTFYNPIADICQMVVNIIIEREIKDGRQVGANRMMYFQSNGLVDAGGRFNGLPEKLPLSADSFMDAFETGVKSSMIGGNVSDKEIKKMQDKENKERETNVEKAQKAEKNKKSAEEELAKKQEMLSLFQSKAKSLTSEKLGMIKTINDEYSITPDMYKNVADFPMEALEKYMEVLK